jgi:hypothetical protein
MRKAYRRMFFLALVPLLFVLGCGEQGKVEQGRVIAFDKGNRKVTLVLDSLPDPKAGYRMKLDTEKNEIVILDPASGSFKTIHYTQVNRKENVAKDDDLVFDRARKESRKFPVVDASKKTISIYSARQNLLLTFTVPDEYFSLPEKVWDAGDEVRIYCKERGKAARLMNISKIDIFQ